VSDEELPRTVAAFPAHLRRYKQLSERLRRLRREAAGVKGKVEERSRKQEELLNHMRHHMQDVSRSERELKQKEEVLEGENSDLKQRSLQVSVEHENIEERLQEGKKQLSETENRIQRLMDRLVTLLSNGATTDGVRVQFTQELEESVELYAGRLEQLKQQLMQARTDNRKAALQLSDEQRRTKRLHDHLCKKQSHLFNPSWAQMILNLQHQHVSSSLLTSNEVPG